MGTVSNYFAPATAIANPTPATLAPAAQPTPADLIAAAHQATLAALNAADLNGIDPDAIKYLYDAAIALNKAKNVVRDI